MNEPEVKKTNKGCMGCSIAFMSLVGLVFICVVFNDNSDNNNTGPSSESNYSSSSVTPSSEDAYTFAAAHMWSGIKLYYGSNKEYFGEIVCFRRGYDGLITIKNSAGNLIRKQRATIRNSQYYVKSDDPAIKSMQYYDCDD
jgi:hypothetical protein